MNAFMILMKIIGITCGVVLVILVSLVVFYWRKAIEKRDVADQMLEHMAGRTENKK